MKRFCAWHGAHVPEDQAVLVDGHARVSGPDVPVYACRDCATRLSLTVVSDERCCARCGRQTADWIRHEPDDDRGPLEIAWCRDAVLCETARAAARSRMPRRAMHP